MKKIFLILLMFAITVATFAQTAADSTFATSISSVFGISFTAVLWIIGIVGSLVGHLVINNKWWSIFKLIQSGWNWFMSLNKGENK